MSNLNEEDCKQTTSGTTCNAEARRRIWIGRLPPSITE